MEIEEKDSTSLISKYSEKKKSSIKEKDRYPPQRESNLSSMKKLLTKPEAPKHYALKIINKGMIKTKKDVQQAMS